MRQNEQEDAMTAYIIYNCNTYSELLIHLYPSLPTTFDRTRLAAAHFHLARPNYGDGTDMQDTSDVAYSAILPLSVISTVCCLTSRFRPE